MADPIVFDRKPYKITYQDQNGVKKTIRRVPPPKIHDSLPMDIVELNVQKNEDWKAGKKFEVVGINPRHPNVLQLVNSDGEKTFVSSLDTTLREKRAPRDGVDPRDVPISNRYLLWP